MGVKLNPFTGQFDLTGGAGSLPTIGQPVIGADPNSLLGVDDEQNLVDYTLTDGQVIIGATGGSPAARTLTGTTDQVNITNGPNSITLSLPQSIAQTSSPTFANVSLSPSGSLDTASAGTLAIGTANASVINIGNAGATVNLQGTIFYENVTQLQVKDPLITLNKGGAAGSASNSGIELEENGAITSYLETSADRNSWTLKAPNTAGVVTITPGSAGFSLNQGSHDPLTLTAVGSTPSANGASLISQALTLQPADATHPGLVSITTQTFSGDKTLSGTTTALAIKNSNIYDSAFNLAINTESKLLYDYTTNKTSVDWVNRYLADFNGTAGLNWGNRRLFDVFGNESIYWNDRLLFDNNANSSINWNSRQLMNPSGVTNLDYSSSTSVIFPQLTASKPLFLDASKNVIAQAFNLSTTTYTSGLLPAGRGGTGVDASSAAIGTLLIGTGSGFAVSLLTAGQGITIDRDVASITINSSNSGLYDIGNKSFTGLVNNTPNQNITGFVINPLAIAFEALVNIRLNATATTYSTYKILGTKKGTDWSTNDLAVEYDGDTIPGFAVGMTAVGQVQLSIGNITGLTTSAVKFRAITLN